VKPEELKNVAVMLRELGLSYEETLVAVSGVAKDSHFVGRLWREGNILVSAGVIQAKIKRSTLHVEDVYKTFPKLIKELQTGKRELIW
jgi:hypothetical protein